MKRKSLLLLGIVVVVAAVFGVACKVNAVDKSAISISPLTFDLSANPGDSLINEMIVRNGSSEPVVINMGAQDFVASGEEGDISLTEEKSTYSLSQWVEVNTDKFVIQPGRQERIKFIIRVPVNAEPGGHYASVLAQLSPSLESQNSGAFVGQKIGALVLLRVSGAITESANVEEFTAEKVKEGKGYELIARIKNTGSVHIKPKGMIAITDIWGNKVADIAVDQKNVLPGAIRRMSGLWEETPWFGKYTATLLSYYGQNNQQMIETTTFWIVPWKEFIIAGIIIIVLAVLVYLGRKRLKEAYKALIGKKR